MGKLLKSYLMPHPPIMISQIGRGEENKIISTVESAMKVSEEIVNLKPDTIVMVVPPHGPAFGDAMSINIDNRLTGNMGNFGASNVKFDYEVDRELADAIIKNCNEKNIPAAAIDKEISKTYRIPAGLDHGSMVPLYFVNRNYNTFKLVHITYGLLSNEELYHFGRILRESIEETDRNAVFIASGDLSHRLSKDAPAGYNAMGSEFDGLLVEKLKEADAGGIMKMDKNLIESAGECGYRSIITLLGVLDGLDAECKVMSYEGPFGVGYCIASYETTGRNESKEKVSTYYDKKKKKIEEIRKNEDPYVRLARESLEYYLAHGREMPVPDNLPDEMTGCRAGVFVSIKKDNSLRGCIGTIAPTKENLAMEIISNAISAGTGDPRFYPVDEDELGELVYSVDILGEPERVDSREELDSMRFGVIVRKGRKSGLLLPNLEGVDTVEEQISIALKKAGIGEREDYSMERFEVIRHR